MFLNIAINLQENESATGATRFLRQDTPDTYRITNQDNTIEIELKKRDPYPTTYCQTTDTEASFGYGMNKNSSSEEYLHCHIDYQGNLRIKRDAFATLPIFYSATAKSLIISNDYSTLLSRMPATNLSRAGLVELMALERFIARPIVENVSWLGEMDQLHYKKGELKIESAPDRPWNFSSDLAATDPKGFRKAYDAYLDYFIDSRLKNQSYACEVSGGLDSATLPQYLSLRRNQRSLFSSLIHYGDKSDLQVDKIDDLLASSGLGIVTNNLDPEKQFPLSRMQAQSKPTYFEKTYFEASKPIYEELNRRGVKVLVGGVGGDEMFGHVSKDADNIYWGEFAKERRIKQQLPSFAKADFKQTYVNSTPQEPIYGKPRRPYSVTYSSLANNALIDYDIWPVSPFVDYELYEYCQGLPIQYRANKNILRAYHHAHGFSPKIYDTKQNEDFNYFATLSYKSAGFRNLFEEYFKDAITVQLGYVDPVKLRDSFDAVQKLEGDGGNRAGFEIYLWLVAEINARHCSKL